jgi:hypothetical protein
MNIIIECISVSSRILISFIGTVVCSFAAHDRAYKGNI